ncbi:MAG TPA: TonB-dependent receptor [Rhizomicrobium sp.]|nr:TonB-dependent receptor [Rhizomicrobium sp.]
MPFGKARWGALAGLWLCAGLWSEGARAQQVADADIQQLSIEQLANVEITSVSKAPQSLSTAAAAIYVISHDDVIRSGATSLPEMLRLAPNLEVMQAGPANYEITARGFNGNSADQNFPDKLLVLIDGRSVYSPLYSGVYWDVQDVMPDDVERIEVISGPGGTLWGANAVNGVINIITRKASDTPGGLLTVGVGDQYSSSAVQYGGSLADNVDYRIYAKDFWQRSFDGTTGTSVHDSWTKPQGGFRVDWNEAQDQVTLQGDIYSGAEGQLGGPDLITAGGNLTGHWQHRLDEDSSFQLLTYYDETQRQQMGGGGIVLNTYDVEGQHNFRLGSWNNIVWGGGDRILQYGITNEVEATSSLLFEPGHRTLNLADIFAQDRIPLADTVELTVGLKLENDPYSGISPMPSGRLSWQVAPDHMVWGAISRAVRSPTPFDTDVVEKLGATTFLTGNPNFLPEQVTAYELGYRGRLFERVSLSVSAFDNVYDDLKDVEPTPVTTLPLMWANMMKGNVHGVEAWASFQALDWWRLDLGFNAQHEDLSFQPGSFKLLGIAQAGDDPHHQASLRSSMNLPYDLNFDADFRYVGALPDPALPEYVELNSRLAWKVSDTLSVALAGYNLLHGQHLEYPGGDQIRRSVYFETRLRF